MIRRLRFGLAAALLCSLALTFPTNGDAATALPHAEADALDGSHVTIPDTLRGRPAILIVAVSRAASGHLEAWSDRLALGAGERAAVTWRPPRAAVRCSPSAGRAGKRSRSRVRTTHRRSWLRTRPATSFLQTAAH